MHWCPRCWFFEQPKAKSRKTLSSGPSGNNGCFRVGSFSGACSRFFVYFCRHLQWPDVESWDFRRILLSHFFWSVFVWWKTGWVIARFIWVTTKRHWMPTMWVPRFTCYQIISFRPFHVTWDFRICVNIDIRSCFVIRLSRSYFVKTAAIVRFSTYNIWTWAKCLFAGAPTSGRGRVINLQTKLSL